MQTFIHIGLPKTATTFLQDVVFPEFNDIQLITTPITYYNDDFIKLKYADDSLIQLDKVKEYILNLSKSESVIISDEFLSGFPIHLCNINRTKIAERLQYVCPNATIIIFLRGQEDILHSLHNQYVKVRIGTKRIGEFYKHPQFAELFKSMVGRKLETPFPYYSHNTVAHLDSFLYYELILLYKKLFKNVEVFLYEDLQTKPKETLDRLSRIIGKNYNVDIETLINKNINISLSVKNKEYLLFHQLSRFVLRKKWITKMIFPMYYHLKIKPLLAKENQYITEICKAYFTENNQKLIKEFDIPIHQYPDKYFF